MQLNLDWDVPLNDREGSLHTGEPVDIEAAADQLLTDLLAKFPLKKSVVLEWRALRVSAGRAAFVANRISLSRTLLTDLDRMRSTLKHEFAHLLAHDRCGKHGMGHGAAWRQAMRDLGEEPLIYHDYPVERNAKRQTVIYKCLRCRARFQRRRRLPKRGRYVHANCGGQLDLVSIDKVAS